jgi:hypothetical protein
MLLALVSLTTIRLKLTPSRNAAAPILAVASSVDARTFSAAMRQLQSTIFDRYIDPDVTGRDPARERCIEVQREQTSLLRLS